MSGCLALAESADGERLLVDEWHERTMRKSSLRLLRAIETAQGKYAPAKPRLTRPPYISAVSRIVSIPGEGVGKSAIRKVALGFGMTVGDMLSQSRRRRMVCARVVAAKLLREMTWEDGSQRFSLPQIAKMLNRKDHSTICYSLSVFEPYCRTYPEMLEVYNLVRGTA